MYAHLDHLSELMDQPIAFKNVARFVFLMVVHEENVQEDMQNLHLQLGPIFMAIVFN